jgi:lipopolysaccharide transport system ATP-binding protein
MGEIAIRVQGLSKRYRIGGRRRGYQTLRDRLAETVAARFHRLGMTDHKTTDNMTTDQSPVACGPVVSGQLSRGHDESIWALKDVSFEVKRGEVVGVIGRNGAGKSTLLKIFARITAPTAGRVEVYGRVGSLLEVGTGFHPELTGQENIYLNGAILGMRKAEIEGSFDEIVAFAEVEPFLDTPVKHYSSGMRVRLAFAVAAHLEPEILLVDEVLAVGDIAFQKKCLGKMGEVAKGGRTVLFVSHNMSAVLNLSSRCLLFDRGAISFDGPTQETIERYVRLAVPQQGSHVAAAEHPGRPHGMRSVIQSLTLLRGDETGPLRDGIRTGDDLVFEIAYDTGDQRLDYAALGISSSLGERICTVGTHLTPGFEGVMLGRGVIECRIPRLPLANGEYSVLVAVGTRMPIRNVDYIEDVLRFRVDGTGYFGTSARLLRGQGHLAQRSEWRLMPANVTQDMAVPTTKKPAERC